MGSAELENAFFDDVHTLEELTEALRRYLVGHPLSPGAKPAESWVNACHMPYLSLPAGSGLTRQQLDAILPDRPLAVMAFDYHTLWANSRALELGGLLPAGSPQQKLESGIVLGEDGLPSGELREPATYGRVLRLTGAWGRAASGLFDQEPAIVAPTELLEEQIALRRGLALNARYGVTSVHNMDGSQRQAELYAYLEASGELSCRVYLPINIKPETPLEPYRKRSSCARLMPVICCAAG